MWHNGTTVGIGVSVPQAQYKTHISRGTSQGTALALQTEVDGAAFVRLRFINSTTFEGSGLNSSYIDGIRITGTGAEELRFGTSTNGSVPVEKMRLDGNGYLGIGTTTPARQLTVFGTDTAVTALLAPNASTLYMGVSTTSDFARWNYSPSTDQLKLQGTHNSSPFNDIMTFDWSSGISKIGIGAAPNVSTPSRLYVYSASGTISDNGVLFAESGASTGKAFFAKATTGTTAAGVFEVTGTGTGPSIVAKSPTQAIVVTEGDVYLQNVSSGIIMRETSGLCGANQCRKGTLINGVIVWSTCFTCP